MPRFSWKALNKHQVGTYFEYFVKMELTMYGYEVYTTEVDDRAIDFIARKANSSFIEVQAKCLRKFGYVFMRKATFQPKEGLYVALGLLNEGKEPVAYLIPSTVWFTPNSVFVDRDYDAPELTSKPEWGINVSAKNLAALEKYEFSRTLAPP